MAPPSSGYHAVRASKVISKDAHSAAGENVGKIIPFRGRLWAPAWIALGPNVRLTTLPGSSLLNYE